MRVHNVLEVRLLYREAELRTERAEHSEQAISVSELSYRRLFEAAQDGILILDVETGRITDVNPFLCKLSGFSHADRVDKTVGELSPFKDIESNQAMLERLQHATDGFLLHGGPSSRCSGNRNFPCRFDLGCSGLPHRIDYCCPEPGGLTGLFPEPG